MPALVKATTKKVFAIAGYGDNRGYSPTVSCYDINRNEWIRGMDCLNMGRWHASACVLHGIVYVFAGAHYTTFLNSIEYILEDFLLSPRIGSFSRWWLIKIDPKLFSPHCNPAVAPINSTEIAIFGGRRY